MNPNELPLRDIHLPEPVSWWPLATGWWLSLALLLALGAFVMWWRRSEPTRRARNAALGELTTIELAYARAGDGHACAQALSRLLRRLALLADASQSAHARGEEFAQVLTRLGKTPVPPEVLALLREAPYSPAAAAALDPALYRRATESLRAWLRGLRVPRHPAANISHAAV